MLPKILHVLIDNHNLGVLYVSSDQAVINFLKEGFMEGSNRILLPTKLSDGGVDHSTFISPNDLENKHVAWTNGPKLTKLNPEYITENFLEQKRLAFLRAPVIFKISQRVFTMLKDKCINMPLPHSFDSCLQAAVDNSDPANDFFHRDIIELSRILGWKPVEAYKDLKLRLESSNSFKVKIYGITSKYIAMVNQCTTKQELDQVEEEYDIITTKNQKI